MTNPFRIQSENTENAMNTLLIMQMTNPIRKKCNDISAEMEIQYFCAEGIDLLKISKLMKKLCKVDFYLLKIREIMLSFLLNGLIESFPVYNIKLGFTLC